MEEVRLLLIGFCIYGIVYCVYAFNIVLAYREVQTRRFEQIETMPARDNKGNIAMYKN